jgi:hypothetical protein
VLQLNPPGNIGAGLRVQHVKEHYINAQSREKSNP